MTGLLRGDTPAPSRFSSFSLTRDSIAAHVAAHALLLVSAHEAIGADQSRRPGGIKHREDEDCLGSAHFMQGTLLRFCVHEDHRHHRQLVWEWLLEQGNKLGIRGGSAFEYTPARLGVINPDAADPPSVGA